MAGDWIKMRVDLWDDPRVVRIVSALDADKATVCGALYRVWSLADQYTEDGRLVGYTPDALEQNAGVPGLCDAMQRAGWLVVKPDALVFPRFGEHNGQSAKRRAQERERKRRVRNSSASDADKKRTREEERERREEPEKEKTLTSDLDGAMRFSEEKRGEVLRWVDRIRRDVPCKVSNDWSLIAKAALLAVTGGFSEDDIEQCLESVRAKKPKKPASWFHKCLSNKAEKYGETLNAMLATVEIPPWLAKPRAES